MKLSLLVWPLQYQGCQNRRFCAKLAILKVWLAGENLGSEPSKGWRFSALKFGSLALLVPYIMALWRFLGEFALSLHEFIFFLFCSSPQPALSNLEKWGIFMQKLWQLFIRKGLAKSWRISGVIWRKIGDFGCKLAKTWRFLEEIIGSKVGDFGGGIWRNCLSEVWQPCFVLRTEGR